MIIKTERLAMQIRQMVQQRSDSDITEWILQLHNTNSQQYNLLTTQRNVWYQRSLYLSIVDPRVKTDSPLI